MASSVCSAAKSEVRLQHAMCAAVLGDTVNIEEKVIVRIQ